MKLVRDWWLPDSDTHFEGLFLGPPGEARPLYQGAAQIAAIDLVLAGGRTGLMVDVGAHVGTWAWGLGSVFRRVCCFEPILENRECLLRNAPRAEVYPYALWGFSGGLKMRRPEVGNSGSWEPGRDVKVKCRRLDEFGFVPDLVKIDVQGGEVAVLHGGEGTITAHKPIVVIEENPSAADWLTDRGYARLLVAGKDAIYIADQA